MNKFILTFLVLVGLIITAGPASAQDSAINTVAYFMNMNSSTWASVVPNIYDSTGALVHTGDPINLQGFGMGSFDMGSTALGAGSYTLILDSDQPLSAVAVRSDATLADSTAMYEAQAPSSTHFFPYINISEDLSITSVLYVSNPGDAPVEMTATFYTEEGETQGTPVTATIPAKGVETIDFAALPSRRGGAVWAPCSGVVETSAPCSAYLYTRDPKSCYAQPGNPAGATTNYFPTASNGWNGKKTWFILMNPSPYQANGTRYYHNQLGERVDGGAWNLPPKAWTLFSPDQIPGSGPWSLEINSDNPCTASAIYNNDAGSKACVGSYQDGSSSAACPLVEQETLLGSNCPSGGDYWVNYYSGYGEGAGEREGRLQPKGSWTWKAQEDLGGAGYWPYTAVVSGHHVNLNVFMWKNGAGANKAAKCPGMSGWLNRPVFTVCR